MNATIYYSPDAVGSTASIFFDGEYMYERVHGLGSLGALDGWLKRIRRKVKHGIKKVSKYAKKTIKRKIHKIKKVAKKAGKIVKKVAKTTVKVIRKALPIVNTALTFLPGVGWAVKAGLEVAEMGLSAAHKASLKRKRQKQMKALNSKKTTLVKPVKPVSPVQETMVRKPVSQPKVQRPVKRSLPVYTATDFMKINNAVTRNQVRADQVAALAKYQVDNSLKQILN